WSATRLATSPAVPPHSPSFYLPRLRPSRPARPSPPARPLRSQSPPPAPLRSAISGARTAQPSAEPLPPATPHRPPPAPITEHSSPWWSATRWVVSPAVPPLSPSIYLPRLRPSRPVRPSTTARPLRSQSPPPAL